MEIYNQLPEELQNKVFYFMSHPCADMIKKSYLERINTWGDTVRKFTARIPKGETQPIEFNLHKYDEEFWNRLIEKIRKEKERYNILTELDDMRNEDYDAYTGNVFDPDLDWYIDSVWWGNPE